MDQQAAKERACHLAIRRGLSLFSRGHRIYGVYADGAEVFVCRGTVANMWGKALQAMLHLDMRAREARFVLRTSAAEYRSSSAVGLLYRWARDLREGSLLAVDDVTEESGRVDVPGRRG